MDNAFAPWIGQAVVLQVALGEGKVALRGKLVKDCGDAVRVRLGENNGQGWDVDIYKSMILAVEQDGVNIVAA